MRISHRILCLLAVLILAAPIAAMPATAVAQSAGDDQYVDPFQDDQTGKDKGNGNGGGGSGSQSNDGGGSDSSSSQGSTSGSDSGSTAGTTAAQSGQDDQGKLPRTGGGLPEGWIVAVGVLLLLGGGFALRRVWPRPD
jgi:LPXTG-motif cell wall-anchored protein